MVADWWGDQRCKKVTYRGVQYDSITACLKAYGLKINNFTVYKRCRLPEGLSLNEAIAWYIDRKLAKRKEVENA